MALPGGELFTALQTGVIDATEWVGPYNDLALGLHTVAKYYYYPGWHEPGTTLEAIVNKDAWNSLPEDLQAILRTAAQAVNDDLLAEFTARNNTALKTLVDEHGVKLRRLPDDVLEKLAETSAEVVRESIGSDALAKRIYDSYYAFLRGCEGLPRVLGTRLHQRALNILELKATAYETRDGIATIWLDRSHRMNAWTGRMHTEYRWLLARADEDDAVRAIVVTGAWPRLLCRWRCAGVGRTR